MFRRQLIALGLAFAMLLPLPAAADDRASAAAGLVDQMIADLEAFLATDTGDVEARSAEIDRVLTSYFDMDSITRFSAGPYWRAADEAQRTEYGSLFREVLCGTIVRNFDKLNGLAYTAGGSSTKGDKFVIVSGTFTDTSGAPPAGRRQLARPDPRRQAAAGVRHRDREPVASRHPETGKRRRGPQEQGPVHRPDRGHARAARGARPQ